MLLLEYRNEDTTSCGELNETVADVDDQANVNRNALLGGQ